MNLLTSFISMVTTDMNQLRKTSLHGFLRLKLMVILLGMTSDVGKSVKLSSKFLVKMLILPSKMEAGFTRRLI